MEEFILVPAKEDPQEVARVKGELTDNARLTYAGRLGAKRRRILKDRTLSPDEKMKKLLPMSRAFATASRRVRQFNIPSAVEGETGEDEDTELLTPALHKWMRRMVRTLGPQTATAAAAAVPAKTPFPTTVKKVSTLRLGKPSIPRKPKIERTPARSLPAVSPKPKKLEMDLYEFPPPPPPLSPEPGPSWRDPSPFPFHDEDLADAIKKLRPTPKGKGKGKAKSPLETALETALETKFASTKEDDGDEGESDEEEGWLRLRPRPHTKQWEEW